MSIGYDSDNVVIGYDSDNVVMFTEAERREVDDARDTLHRAVLNVLKAHRVDTTALDLSEAGESIALEGQLQL